MEKNFIPFRRAIIALLLLCVLALPMQYAAYAGGLPTDVTLTADDFIITGGKATGLTPGVAARLRGNNIIIDNIAGLSKIGSAVFEGLTLNAVTIGAGIDEIEQNAFRNKGITKVTLRDTSLSLGTYAFEGNNIGALDGNATLSSVGTAAFYNNSLSSLDMQVGTIGARAFGANSLTEMTLHGVTAVAAGAFQDNPALKKVTIDTADPPMELFAAGAFGTAPKTPPIVVEIAQNANNVTEKEPAVYLVNPITLVINHRDKLNGGVLINSIEQVMALDAIPASYTAPALAGYTIETNPVPIDRANIVDRRLEVDVNYIKLGKPRIVVSPSKQLLFPKSEPAFNAEKILQDVHFYDPLGQLIQAVKPNGTLDERITINPTSIPYTNTERTVTVQLTLKEKPDSQLGPGEVNQTATAALQFEFKSTDISTEEIIEGKGWLYHDFTYNGRNVTGLSPSGIAKLATNPDMVLPDRNPATGVPIQVIAQNAFMNQSVNTVNFEKMTQLTAIGSNAFRNSGINALLNLSSAAKLRAIETNSFQGNKLSAVDVRSLPELQYISDAAFMDNRLESVDLSGLQNLQRIGHSAFRNNSIRNFSISNNPKLRHMGNEVFRNNRVEEASLRDLPELESIGWAAFMENQIKNAEIQNLPKMLSIGDNAFYSNKIETLRMVELPQLKQIPGSNTFSFNQIREVELTDLPQLEILNGFRNNQIERLTLENLPNLKQIGAEAFRENKIRELDLSNLPALERIQYAAFYKNPITSLKLDGLPNLTMIANEAFAHTQIEDLMLRNLPKITTISGFNDIKTLKTVELDGLPLLSTLAGFGNSHIESLALKNLTGLTTIGGTAFYNNKISSLTMENLPVLRHIASHAFANNQLQGDLNLNDFPALEIIDINAFSNNQLQRLNVSNLNNLKKISQNAFAGNHLETVTIKDLPKLEEIGVHAFYHQKGGVSLNSVTVENLPLLTKLGGFAYNYQMDNLRLHSLPQLTEITNEAFYNNKLSGTLDLSPFTNLKTIAANSFSSGNVGSLRNDYSKVVFPNSVSRIENRAFYNNKVADIDLSHLSNLSFLGDEAFNTYSTNQRVFVANSLKLPVTAQPIELGWEIANVKPEHLDFSSTPGVKVRLRSSKPFSVAGGGPLIMKFKNTDQVSIPANPGQLDPNNPTILYIENYDGSLNPPPGILINPTKLTIRHLNKADNTPVMPNLETVRYISANTVIESGSFTGLRATEIRVTPNNGDTFNSATRQANIVYAPNVREKTLDFLYEPVGQLPTSDYNVTLNRINNTNTEFHINSRVTLESTFQLQNIPAGEGSSKFVIELPPHTTDNPARVVFPSDIPGVELAKPPYYDPVTKRVVYEVRRFPGNSAQIQIRVEFEFDKLDTPQRIEEKAKSYYVLENGAIKGNVAESQPFKPWYYERSATKHSAEGVGNTIYQLPAEGSDGKYANTSILYEFRFSSERRLREIAIEDALPSYEKWDPATNSYVTALAGFDAAKNPGWTLSGDGKKVFYTVEKATLDSMTIPDGQYLPHYLIPSAMRKLTLDYPMAKLGQQVNNVVAMTTRIHDPQAQDVPEIRHTNTVSHRIEAAAGPVNGRIVKSIVGSSSVQAGTGNASSDYPWKLTIVSEKTAVKSGATTTFHDRKLTNIEAWDHTLDGNNDATRLLEYRYVLPDRAAKIYLYTNEINGNGPATTAANKPNLAALTLLSGPISLDANQRYNLTADEIQRTRSIRIVYENLTLTGAYESANVIIGSGNRNGQPFPRMNRYIGNNSTMFADSEVLGTNFPVAAIKNISGTSRYLQAFKRTVQATKTANYSDNTTLTNRGAEIRYDVGYIAAYRNINNADAVGYSLPDFKLVDIVPAELMVKDVILNQAFVELGGTMQRSMDAEGNTVLTFRMPQAPNGTKQIARLRLSVFVLRDVRN